MREEYIPVDLFNPGQVFACLGFLEVVDALNGNAVGRFDWSNETQSVFHLSSESEIGSFEGVLDAITSSTIAVIYPNGWPDSEISQQEEFPSPLSLHQGEKAKFTDTKLPGVLKTYDKTVPLGSWSDGSCRPDFKLYSGNRSGYSIASDMLLGKRDKPKKGKTLGEIINDGIKQLYEKDRQRMLRDPLNYVCAMAGSFNLDPRGAWNSMDAGYSPNEHKHAVAASPVVELFACLALEHMRPRPLRENRYCYAVWDIDLPPILARPAAAGISLPFSTRRFEFELALSGKNKLVTFSHETNQSTQ